MADLNQAIYSQPDATFRGVEFEAQWDVVPVRAAAFRRRKPVRHRARDFTDDTDVPRIPPLRLGGGVFWRDAAWLARVRLLHAFAQNDIAVAGETPTAGYDDLRAELSYKWKPVQRGARDLTEGLARHRRHQSAQPRHTQQRVLFRRTRC